MKPAIAIALASLLLVGPASLRAEHPKVEAVRSIVSSPAWLTEVGQLEIELGGSQVYARDRSREGGIGAQFNLGVTSWLDLRLGVVPQAWNRDADGGSNRGAGDPFFGGKLLFLPQEKAGFDLGLTYYHHLPRASTRKGLSSGYHEDEMRLAATHRTHQWELDANLGLVRTRVEDGSRKANQKVGSFAITYMPTPGWKVTLDTYGAAKSDLGGRELGNVLALSHDVSEKLTLDVSVARGWADASPRFAVNAGLIYRLSGLFGK